MTRRCQFISNCKLIHDICDKNWYFFAFNETPFSVFVNISDHWSQHNVHRCEHVLNPCTSEFQSDILTLQTSTPDLTDCFQNTVLVWIPCGFFWISMIYWIPFLRQQERRSHWGQSSVLNLVKSVRANIFPPIPTLTMLTWRVHHEPQKCKCITDFLFFSN